MSEENNDNNYLFCVLVSESKKELPDYYIEKEEYYKEINSIEKNLSIDSKPELEYSIGYNFYTRGNHFNITKSYNKYTIISIDNDEIKILKHDYYIKEITLKIDQFNEEKIILDNNEEKIILWEKPEKEPEKEPEKNYENYRIYYLCSSQAYCIGDIEKKQIEKKQIEKKQIEKNQIENFEFKIVNDKSIIHDKKKDNLNNNNDKSVIAFNTLDDLNELNIFRWEKKNVDNKPTNIHDYKKYIIYYITKSTKQLYIAHVLSVDNHELTVLNYYKTIETEKIKINDIYIIHFQKINDKTEIITDIENRMLFVLDLCTSKTPTLSKNSTSTNKKCESVKNNSITVNNNEKCISFGEIHTIADSKGINNNFENVDHLIIQKKLDNDLNSIVSKYNREKEDDVKENVFSTYRSIIDFEEILKLFQPISSRGSGYFDRLKGIGFYRNYKLCFIQRNNQNYEILHTVEKDDEIKFLLQEYHETNNNYKTKQICIKKNDEKEKVSDLIKAIINEIKTETETETAKQAANEEKVSILMKNIVHEINVIKEETARLAAIEKARLAAIEKARLETEEEARLAAIEKTRKEDEEAARIAAIEKARLETEEAATLVAEKARIEAEEKKVSDLIQAIINEIKAEAESAKQGANEEKVSKLMENIVGEIKKEEEKTRLAAIEKARLEAEEAARLAAIEKARLEAEQAARLAAIEKARLEAEEEAARLAAIEKARKEAEKKVSKLMKDIIGEINAESETAIKARLEAEEEARLAAEDSLKNKKIIQATNYQKVTPIQADIFNIFDIIKKEVELLKNNINSNIISNIINKLIIFNNKNKTFDTVINMNTNEIANNIIQLSSHKDELINFLTNIWKYTQDISVLYKFKQENKEIANNYIIKLNNVMKIMVELLKLINIDEIEIKKLVMNNLNKNYEYNLKDSNKINFVFDQYNITPLVKKRRY